MDKKIIEEMRRLRVRGETFEEIAQKVGVSKPTVFYHLDKSYRKKMINKSLETFKKKTLKERKEIYKKRLPYIKAYFKKRYWGDEKFRERVKKRAREYQRKKRKNDK